MGLDVVEIVMALEEHFGVTLPDERAGQAVTAGSMHSLICELLAEKRDLDVEALKSEVWDGLVAIVSEQMGMDPSEITPESKWVGDITQYG